jgi:phosphoglycerate dehydrogenase-like enzyme
MFASQASRTWHYRMTERIVGTKAVIYGVGSIGREVAAVLQGVGVEIAGIGRSARSGVPVFGDVHANSQAAGLLAEADWVIGVLPGTDETKNHFNAAFFERMKPTARFYNIGRGTAVDEAALVAALEAGSIAGAGLDVFAAEPLPQDDPIWSAPNLIVSPHISGDFIGHQEAMVGQFIENLERYLAGTPLENIVDKQAGYVRD